MTRPRGRGARTRYRPWFYILAKSLPRILTATPTCGMSVCWDLLCECTWSIGPFGPSSAMCIGRQAATAAVAQHPPDSAPLAEASSLMWGDAHAWMDMHASVRHANACVRSMSMNMELARLCTQWAWCLERKARCVVAKMNEESIGRQVSHSSTRT